MATKNNRRVLITKRIFKETLIELLKEKEISQISIRELCEIADLNRSTFYLHYIDQFDLLNSLEEEVISNTLEQFKNADTLIISPKVIEIFLDYIQKNGDLFQVLLCKRESSRFKDKLIDATANQLKKSLKFKINDDLLPYSYTFLMEGCSGILIKWINDGFIIEAKKMAELIFELCQSARLVNISNTSSK